MLVYSVLYHHAGNIQAVHFDILFTIVYSKPKAFYSSGMGAVGSLTFDLLLSHSITVELVPALISARHGERHIC
jgi:hypothetical protein